jgi:hypothetical protein
MSQPIGRSSKNSQFAHAAAAMGAFWDRARKSEARRLERVRRTFVESARAFAASAQDPSRTDATLRRSS